MTPAQRVQFALGYAAADPSTEHFEDILLELSKSPSFATVMAEGLAEADNQASTDAWGHKEGELA